MIKKMLVGYIQDGKHSGIDKYLLNFCDVAYEQGATLDFMCDAVDGELDARFKKMGFGLVSVPSLKNPFTQYRKIKKIIKAGGYDAVYLNISEAFNCIGLLAAFCCRVPVRIVHSHSSGVDRSSRAVRTVRTLLHKLAKPFVSHAATKRYACSSAAGRWLYTKDFEIINNAVNTDRFYFDPQKRIDTRAAFGLSDDAVVLCHIGHFCYAKNSFFLVDIVKQALEINKNVHLLSVGIGVDFDAVCDYAKAQGVQNNITFVGVTNDVPDILCASDVFVLPSRFEGLGIVLLEAQLCTLPCVASTNVPAEAKISDLCEFIPLNDAKLWAKKALELAAMPRSESSFDALCVSLQNVKKQLIHILENV